MEELCEEVANLLVMRDHSVSILTSNYGVHGITGKEKNVLRLLNLDMDIRPIWSSLKFFTGRHDRLVQDIQTLKSAIELIEPDLFVVWGAWNISRWVLAQAEQILPNRVIYYFADCWPTVPDANTQHWQGRGRKFITRLPYALLGRIALIGLKKEPRAPELKFEKTICVSQALKSTLIEYGLPIKNAEIIYNGIHVENFFQPVDRKKERNTQLPLSLLYAGRLAQEKGVHLAINAVNGLIRRGYLVHLEIIGQGLPDYVQYLENIVSSLQIDEYVIFSEYVPREKIPQVLASHDVLLVPSLCPDALPRIIQEGMAAGLVVIGAAIGGITEAIDDGVDGLYFCNNDVEDLINKIEQVYNSPDLYERISKAGVQKAAKNFDIRRTVDEMEIYLGNVASSIA